jgi:ribose 5-phosphate isomerase B
LWLQGHEVVDFGTRSPESCHYPEFAAAVAQAVASGEADSGLLTCGTGLGMAIAANKVPGVRAVTVSDAFSAEMARRHNDANIICMGARLLEPQQARAVLRAWLDAGFEGGRHQLRVDMIDRIGELKGRATHSVEDRR